MCGIISVQLGDGEQTCEDIRFHLVEMIRYCTMSDWVIRKIELPKIFWDKIINDTQHRKATDKVGIKIMGHPAELVETTRITILGDLDQQFKVYSD